MMGVFGRIGIAHFRLVPTGFHVLFDERGALRRPFTMAVDGITVRLPMIAP